MWWPRRSGESRQNEGKEMSRYLLKDELHTEEFYVYDDGRDISIRDSLDDVTEEDEKKYTKEWFKYKVPSWNEVANITEMASSGMSPFPSQQFIDRMLILLYLNSASFFEVKRGVPDVADSVEQVLNIEEMLGRAGVIPILVNKIILTIRRRM